MAHRIKLTSKVGTFYFMATQSDEKLVEVDNKKALGLIVVEVPKSHMKLVRDAVMAKVLKPQIDSCERLRSTRDVYEYVRRYVNGPASKTRFLFIPAPGFWIRQGLNQTVGKQHRGVQKAA